MSLDDILKMLQSFGPYTTPLACGMAFAMYYMAKQLKEERTENKGLRDKRTEDLQQSVRDYAEYGEVMRNTLRDFSTQAEATLKAVGG